VIGRALRLRIVISFRAGNMLKDRTSSFVGRAQAAGRRCLKLPFGELRQRLVKVPSVLRTAVLGYAGFLGPAPFCSSFCCYKYTYKEPGVVESASTFDPS